MSDESDSYAIGLDVGGTKVAAGIVALATGALLARRTLPTLPERGGAAVLDDAVSLAAALRDEANGMNLTMCGIGIGVAELTDAQGNITSNHTIGWRGMPVRATFAQLAPAVVEADVRAHALAEARYGAGQRFRVCVFVTVGTGISSCLVQDGRPFAGARGGALVLASAPVSTICDQCGATLHPILEDIASGPALVARYNQATGAQLARAEEIIAAAQAGDETAQTIIGSAGDALGVSIGWLVNVLDPEAVIVGGGLGTAGGRYWERMVASTRAHIWADTARDLPILPAALGPDAGIIGAAASVEAEQLHIV